MIHLKDIQIRIVAFYQLFLSIKFGDETDLPLNECVRTNLQAIFRVVEALKLKRTRALNRSIIYLKQKILLQRLKKLPNQSRKYQLKNGVVFH